jgi:HEAT repeat protein
MAMRGYTEEEKQFARAEMEHGFEMEVQILVFLALATNDADTAREIQKQALAIVDSPLIREAIPKDKRNDDTEPAARRAGPDPADPKALVRDLGSQDATLRESAERRLMELPPEVALAAVLEALPKEKNGQREAAAFESLALQEMLTRLAPRAMTVLVNALRSGEPEIRKATLYTMGELHALAGEAAPAVGALLRNTERDIAILAASVLWQLGPRAVPVLAKALDEGTPEFRVMIAHCCVASPMGGVSDPAEYAAMIPVLRKALKDRHLQPRLAAASALVWLAPAEASGCVAVLNEGLKSPDEETRSLTCGAIQTMARRLETSKPEEVRALLTALGRIGPGAIDAVPVLTRLARENADPGLRAAAEEALAKIVPKEEPERPQELPASIRTDK